MKSNKEKGVTLIALAITVIVILILAGISIGTLKNDGTLDKTQSSAKIETAAEEENVLRLAYTQMEMSEGIANSNLTLDSFKTYMSKHTKEYYIDENVSETEKTKALATTENATKFVKVIFENTGNSYIIGLSEETEKPTYDYYVITYDANSGANAPNEQYNRIGYPTIIASDEPNKDNYNFEGWAISSSSKEVSYTPGSTYNGGIDITLYAVWKDATPPIIDLVTATSSSITIQAHDNETGISGYAISTTNETPAKFTSVTNQTSITQVISPLTQSTTYYLWVKNGDGLISEVKSIKTQTIPEVTLSADKTGWTNGNVVVTAKSNGSTTGYTIQSCTDNKSWKNESSITFTQNGTMYARLIDSSGQVGKTASYNVTIIDKTAPKSATPKLSATTNSIKTEISTDDSAATSQYGKSGISGYRFSSNNGSSYSAWQSKGSYTFTSLAQKTKYNIAIQIKDIAGNITTVTSSTTTGAVPGVSLSASTGSWTNQNLTVKATANSSGYTLQTSTDGKTWRTTNPITFSQNGKMYARLKDSTGQTGNQASYSVTNIDKSAPNSFTPSAGLITDDARMVLSGSTTDKSATTQYGCSGISGYRFSTNNGSSYTGWQSSGRYKLSDLPSATTYNIKMQVKDNAGNITTSNVKTITFILSSNGYTNTSLTSSYNIMEAIYPCGRDWLGNGSGVMVRDNYGNRVSLENTATYSSFANSSKRNRAVGLIFNNQINVTDYKYMHFLIWSDFYINNSKYANNVYAISGMQVGIYNGLNSDKNYYGYGVGQRGQCLASQEYGIYRSSEGSSPEEKVGTNIHTLNIQNISGSYWVGTHIYTNLNAYDGYSRAGVYAVWMEK